MSRDETPDTTGLREAGLQHRYNVEKVNDPTGKHSECRYFVLDPKHDPLARAAIRAYADAARQSPELVALADDLDNLLAAHPTPDASPDPTATSDATGLREAVLTRAALDVDRLLLRVAGFGEPYDRGYTQGVKDSAYVIRELRADPTPDASPDPAVVTPDAGDVPVLAEVVAAHPKPNYMRPICLCGESVSAAEKVGTTLTILWQEHVARAILASDWLANYVAAVREADRAEVADAEERLAGLVAKIEALADNYEVLADYTDDPASTDEQRARARAGVVAAEHLRALIPADAATALDGSES